MGHNRFVTSAVFLLINDAKVSMEVSFKRQKMTDVTNSMCSASFIKMIIFFINYFTHSMNMQSKCNAFKFLIIV